jgi:hypothetical protein
MTFSAGPTFTSGTTNNQAKIESAGATTSDLIVGYDLPNATSSQTYSGTFSASREWAAAIIGLSPAGNTLDNTSPSGSTQAMVLHTVGSLGVWETGYTVGSQTVAAGTYTFTYWTSSAMGSNSSTVTLTFGYSSTATCNSITALASWSATIADGAVGATTSTAGSSGTIPANSYICWQIVVTAIGGSNAFSLEYDTTTFTTNINTPTITVPEYGLALIGLAMAAPFIARRRQREQLLDFVRART